MKRTTHTSGRWCGVALVAALVSAVGCEGALTATPNEICVDDCDRPAPTPPAEPNTLSNVLDEEGSGFTTRFPRLSHSQWEHSVQDLLLLDAPPGLSNTFAPDPSARFDTNANLRRVSGPHWSDYQAASEAVAADVARNATRLGRIVDSNLPTDATERAREWIRRFGRRAYRRPLTETELDTHVALFQQGGALVGGDPFAAGVELTIRAMLQSPHFLYRVEASTTVQDGRIRLNGHEVATRLAYALWNTMPSNALLDAAAAGELDDAAGVERWALQLLDDPRANQTVLAFHEQLFRISGYGTASKDPTRFPTFTAELAPVLRQEAMRFIEDVVVEEGGGIRELLTAPFTYVNNQTAGFYGLSGSFGPELERVDLDPEQRAGILTQLGFLSKNGGLVQSDPIHRGVFINIDLLCARLNPPEFALPPLPSQMPGQTNRDRIDGHTGTCGRGCHDVYINPIGFGFEHYDAIGQWRDIDNGSPVDAADVYRMDRAVYTFDGASDLSTQLAETARLHACYASNWLEFALGRRPVMAEQAALQTLANASHGGDSAKQLLAKITALDSFRTRAQEAL